MQFQEKLKTLPPSIQRYFKSQNVKNANRFKTFCQNQKDAAFYAVIFLAQNGDQLNGLPLNGVIKETLVFSAIDQYRFFDAYLEIINE